MHVYIYINIYVYICVSYKEDYTYISMFVKNFFLRSRRAQSYHTRICKSPKNPKMVHKSCKMLMIVA